MLLRYVDLKCAVHFCINPNWTTPVFYYMDGKHAVSGCITGNSRAIYMHALYLTNSAEFIYESILVHCQNKPGSLNQLRSCSFNGKHCYRLCMHINYSQAGIGMLETQLHFNLSAAYA